MRRRDERGSALVEFTWLGLILLVPLVWILLSVFEVQRGAFATTAAARSAGRAYVLAPDAATGQQRATDAAEFVLSDQGSPGMKATVTVDCEPVPEQCLAPGSTVTVTVSSSVPVPLMPELLGGERPAVKVSAVHRVPVGTFVESSRP